MSSAVAEQIAALERERTRLEGRLAADGNWRALISLQALNGSAPPDAGETEQRLRRSLAANPYYSARIKIVEAITILRRLGEPMPPPAATPAANGHDAVPSMPGIVQHSAPLGPRLGVPLLGDEPKPVREVQSFSAPIPVEAPRSADAAATPAVATPAVATPAAIISQFVEPASDLTRIRAVTPDLAARLAALGTCRFDDIATWTAADVRRIATTLDLGRRISKENWIEQAALLAKAEAAAAVAEPPLAASVEPTAIATAQPDLADKSAHKAEGVTAVPLVPEPAASIGPVSKPAALVKATELGTLEPEPTSPQPAMTSPREWLAQRRGTRPINPPAAPAMHSPTIFPPPIPVTLPTEVEPHDPPIEIVGPDNPAGTAEAAVVITNRRDTGKASGAANPEASTLRSLSKRLLGISKSAETDAAVHARYPGNVEEASVENVRAETDGVVLPASRAQPSEAFGARRPRPAGLFSRFLKSFKARD